MRRVTIESESGAELASGVEPEDVFQLEGNWYFDPARVNSAALAVTERTYTCPYKGTCHWVDYVGPGGSARDVAWVYGDPKPGYEKIRGRFGFYPARRAATVARVEHA
jgi:uncharacterized protein (DUF427 family)